MSHGWLARYDQRVLRVAPRRPLPDVTLAEAEPLAAWRDWCRAEPARHWAVRRVVLPEGVDGERALEALQRELDGDFLLRAQRWEPARCALRAAVKAVDALPGPWRPRYAPWDAGYLADDPAVRAALGAFRPRRPTLIVADPMPEAALQASLEALAAASPAFTRPVRLLFIA
jgi:hypothetical protein